VLLTVPNVSEGRAPAVIERLAGAFGALLLLDVHSDPDHGRSVLTLAGEQGEIAAGLLAGARAAIAAIDVGAHPGLHPHVGALDVAPVVHLGEESRGEAIAAALTAAALIGDELALPVFLYGALAGGRERAEIRAGGVEELGRRMRAGELVPDHGPPEPHPTAGALLVTARPPLVAFNLDLDTDDVGLAREIAAGLRESGGGPRGVRAIGLYLAERGRAQVSLNVHDPQAVPLAELVARVRERAPVAEAELVGLAPRAAFEGFPEDVPLRGFDPERHLIEEALKSTTGRRRAQSGRGQDARGSIPSD
jgi:glutamate formiminotransferase/glutamate formiminotransferase/formiminotetrahydrofolate cyclodeaminase